jgi:hypothetical protein
MRLFILGLLFVTSTAEGFQFSDLENSLWTPCAIQGGLCRFEGTRVIRYGKDNRWSHAVATDQIECSNRQFIDPLRHKANVCEYGKTTNPGIEGPPIVIRPVFYVFKDQKHSGLPNDQDRLLIRHYLEHARDHFKRLLGPDVSSFELADAKIHQGQYEESAISNIAEQSQRHANDKPQAKTADSAPDFEHAMLKEIFEARGSNRYLESSVFVFILVNPNMQLYRPNWGAGGRNFNGGVNGGGGLVVMEYRRLRQGFYSTLVHELGHAFGLTHVNCAGENMSESESIMSYNPKNRSRGTDVSVNPGTLTEAERTSLLLNPRIFAHAQDLKALQDRSHACVLPAMHTYLGSVPNVHGLGYDLTFNEQLVSGFDAMFYTKAQAKRHCAAMRERYPGIRVGCRFAGELL